MYSRRPKTPEELEQEHRRRNAVETVLVLFWLAVAIVVIGLTKAILGISISEGGLPWLHRS